MSVGVGLGVALVGAVALNAGFVLRRTAPQPRRRSGSPAVGLGRRAPLGTALDDRLRRRDRRLAPLPRRARAGAALPRPGRLGRRRLPRRPHRRARRPGEAVEGRDRRRAGRGCRTRGARRLHADRNAERARPRGDHPAGAPGRGRPRDRRTGARPPLGEPRRARLRVRYGLGDVLSKLLLSHLPRHPGLAELVSAPLLVPTLLCHVAAFLLLQRTFQRHGPATAVAIVGTMTAAMNLLPMAAGVLILGHPFPTARRGRSPAWRPSPPWSPVRGSWRATRCPPRPPRRPRGARSPSTGPPARPSDRRDVLPTLPSRPPPPLRRTGGRRAQRRRLGRLGVRRPVLDLPWVRAAEAVGRTGPPRPARLLHRHERGAWQSAGPRLGVSPGRLPSVPLGPVPGDLPPSGHAGDRVHRLRQRLPHRADARRGDRRGHGPPDAGGDPAGHVVESVAGHRVG